MKKSYKYMTVILGLLGKSDNTEAQNPPYNSKNYITYITFAVE